MSRFDMRKLLLTCCLFLWSAYGLSQLVYPVVGTFNNKTAQGMAIFNDTAFLMNDGGTCRMLNLKTGKVTKVIKLKCSIFNPHINTACLRNTIGGDNPYIYISETRNQYRCFVEQILSNSSVLVQTISFKSTGNGNNTPVLNWVVDSPNNCIFGIKRNNIKCKSGEFLNTIYKFRLPKISEGNNVEFSDADVLDKFSLYFGKSLQGCKIRDSLLLVVSGFQEMAQQKKAAKRQIFVIDLKKKCILKTIDLTYVTVNEPEDIDFYQDRILLYCGQNGGIYTVEYFKL